MERFEGLLRLLDVDRNRAGEKYEYVRRRLIKFFQWNSCFPAPELADEAFDRVEQRIADVEILDVVGFIWGVAKNIKQEVHKQAGKFVSISDVAGYKLAGTQSSDENVHEKMQQDRRIRCLQLCLQRMSSEDRELFVAYHDVRGEHTIYRKRLAERLGLTLGSLRVRINRLRDQLEKCARACFASWRLRSRRIP